MPPVALGLAQQGFSLARLAVHSLCHQGLLMNERLQQSEGVSESVLKDKFLFLQSGPVCGAPAPDASHQPRGSVSLVSM